MGRILYVFPHPDDESFGPAPALVRQLREGHEVYLLTLTRGEATRQREKYGFTLEEMGRARYEEMQCVAGVLGLSGLTVLGFPDGGLSELNPLELEGAIRRHVEEVRPNVVVTYPVHGISGHPDHLAGHAALKRVYGDLRSRGAEYLLRLAFFTIPVDGAPGRPAHLKGSPEHAIDCVVPVEAEDLRCAEEALRCYVTYADVVAAHNPLAQVAEGVAFEIFQEDHKPILTDLFAGL